MKNKHNEGIANDKEKYINQLYKNLFYLGPKERFKMQSYTWREVEVER